MKTTEIELVEVDENTSELQCPVCGEVWATFIDGFAEDGVSPCKHLKFQWYGEGGETFGKWDSKSFESFEKSYRDMYQRVNGEECSGDDIFDNGVDYSVLEEMPDNLGVELYSYTESGMCCGPVSFTTIYGVVKPAKKAKK
jgi:hypothetical protein